MFHFTEHDDDDAIDFSALISGVPAESEAVVQAVAQPNERDDERLPRETPPRRQRVDDVAALFCVPPGSPAFSALGFGAAAALRPATLAPMDEDAFAPHAVVRCAVPPSLTRPHRRDEAKERWSAMLGPTEELADYCWVEVSKKNMPHDEQEALVLSVLSTMAAELYDCPCDERDCVKECGWRFADIRNARRHWWATPLGCGERKRALASCIRQQLRSEQGGELFFVPVINGHEVCLSTFAELNGLTESLIKMARPLAKDLSQDLSEAAHSDFLSSKRVIAGGDSDRTCARARARARAIETAPRPGLTATSHLQHRACRDRRGAAPPRHGRERAAEPPRAPCGGR